MTRGHRGDTDSQAVGAKQKASPGSQSRGGDGEDTAGWPSLPPEWPLTQLCCCPLCSLSLLGEQKPRAAEALPTLPRLSLQSQLHTWPHNRTGASSLLSAPQWPHTQPATQPGCLPANQRPLAPTVSGSLERPFPSCPVPPPSDCLLLKYLLNPMHRISVHACHCRTSILLLVRHETERLSYRLVVFKRFKCKGPVMPRVELMTRLQGHAHGRRLTRCCSPYTSSQKCFQHLRVVSP